MAGDEELVDYDGIRSQFRWSIQALAADAKAQRALFPEFVCKADELALDFDHWYLTYLAHFAEALAPTQIDALRMIDRRLGAMSRGGTLFDECLWHEEALGVRIEWEVMRSMARHALEVLGWSSETPPKERSTYVGGDLSGVES